MYHSPGYHQAPPPTYMPSGYPPQAYRTTAVPPSSYYNNPKYFVYTSPPGKGHARRASHEPASYSRPPPYNNASARPTTAHYTATYTSPPRDHVSATEKARERVRSFAGPDGIKQHYHSSSYVKHNSTSRHFAYGPFDSDEYYQSASPPPPYDDYHARVFDDTDPYPQVKHPQPRQYHESTPSRPRATSHTVPPPRAKTAPTPKAAPKATAEDALRARIPAGYSTKNWDPTEEPILLLGSVFDANSLGKWIYDWTVYHHGPATPMSELAGDLWLLLIQLAGKLKRANECMRRIHRHDDRDLVEEFVEAGERLQERFSKILKTCEDYMWAVAKKEAARKKSTASVGMGPKSGCEFVEVMFGRDRKLQDTERVMQGMRLWSWRFDANCEDILRHPSG